MNWYYLNEAGEVAGPISAETLMELRETCSLDGTTLICAKGTQNWEKFDQVFPQQIELEEVPPGHCKSHPADPEATSKNRPKKARLISEPSFSLPPKAQQLGRAFKNLVSSLAKILNQGLATIKRILESHRVRAFIQRAKNAKSQIRSKISELTNSESKENPSSTPNPRKPIDWRFPIGILVAITCTSIIVATISDSRPKPKRTQDTHNQQTTPYASKPKQVDHDPCNRCRGSGNLQGKCTRCWGNGTIMTGNPNSLDPLQSRVPSMRVPCPTCRGGGRMPVPCSHCRGTGHR